MSHEAMVRITYTLGLLLVGHVGTIVWLKTMTDRFERTKPDSRKILNHAIFAWCFTAAYGIGVTTGWWLNHPHSHWLFWRQPWDFWKEALVLVIAMVIINLTITRRFEIPLHQRLVKQIESS